MREAPIIYNSCQTVVVEIKDIAIEGVVEVDLGDRVSQQGRAHIRVDHLVNKVQVIRMENMIHFFFYKYDSSFSLK